MESTGPWTSSFSRWKASVPSIDSPLPAFVSSTFFTAPALDPMYIHSSWNPITGRTPNGHERVGGQFFEPGQIFGFHQLQVLGLDRLDLLQSVHAAMDQFLDAIGFVQRSAKTESGWPEEWPLAWRPRRARR